jgi:hypothetical protein
VILRTVTCLLYEIKATIPEMLTSSFIFLPDIGPVTERDRNAPISGLAGLGKVRLWFQWRRGNTIARDILMSYNRAATENLVLHADRFYKDDDDMVSRFRPFSLSTTLQPAYSQ